MVTELHIQLHPLYSRLAIVVIVNKIKTSKTNNLYWEGDPIWCKLVEGPYTHG